VLGGAATPAEQLKVKLEELDAAVKKYGADVEIAKRAKDFLVDQSDIEKARGLLSVLGGAATPAEQLKVRMQETFRGYQEVWRGRGNCKARSRFSQR